MRDDRGAKWARGFCVTLMVGIKWKVARGKGERFVEIAITDAAVASDVFDVFALGVFVTTRGAADVAENGLRSVNGALIGFTGSQAVIHIVVSDLELGFVETIELAVKIGAREQTSPGDRSYVAGGMR